MSPAVCQKLTFVLVVIVVVVVVVVLFSFCTEAFNGQSFLRVSLNGLFQLSTLQS